MRSAECGVRRASAECGAIALLVYLAGCANKPETAPAPANASVSADRARCISVREKLARYPDLIVDQQPERLSGTFPRMSPARRDTAFTVSFVVNMAGRPVMTSYSVSRHVGPAFAAELRKSVASWRYSPATLEGCAVARKVSHTIDTRARPKTGSLRSPQSAVRSR
jgi:hypothetical protein